MIFTLKAPHPRKSLSPGPSKAVSHPTIRSFISPFGNFALNPYYVLATEQGAGD